MAKAQKVSKATINRIWQSHQIKPHRTKSFKLSRDPNFLEKLTDVVGLYLNPPDKALVLCVDEKSQIQALDRTQPGLPLKKGSCGTMTHDYERHGTTTLFAALEVAQGKVIGQCYARHRHQEFLKFLQRLDAEFPNAQVACGHGQLRHSQASKSAEFGSSDTRVSFPTLPDQFQLAESHRALVRRTNGKTHPAWRLRQCGRSANSDRGFPRRLER